MNEELIIKLLVAAICLILVGYLEWLVMRTRPKKLILWGIRFNDFLMLSSAIEQFFPWFLYLKAGVMVLVSYWFIEQARKNIRG